MNKSIVKWAIGTIVIPIILTMLSIFGIHIKDALFPAPPPEIGNSITTILENRLIILETKLNTLTEVLHVEPVTPVALSSDNGISDADKFKQKIKVKNDSQYSGRKLYVGKKAWDWTIYIETELSVLDKISCVTYQLHPTFKDPTHEMCERGQTTKAFPYSTTGWGTFNVGVKIEFMDGSEFTTDHYLVFTE